MNPYYVVEYYATRIQSKQAESLRMQVEVLCHVQLPPQLFKAGVDSGNKTIKKVHTMEKKASYNKMVCPRSGKLCERGRGVRVVP